MEKKPRTIRSKNRKDFDEFAEVYIGHCRFCGKKFYYQRLGTEDCSLKCHRQHNGWHKKHPRENELLELGIPLQKEWQLEAGYKLIKFLSHPQNYSPEYLRKTYGQFKLWQALNCLDHPLLRKRNDTYPEIPISILIDPEFISDDIKTRIWNERYCKRP
jgi:hypothetical protein